MADNENVLTETRLARGETLTGMLDGLDEEGRVYFRPDEGGESVPVILGLTAPDTEVVRAALAGDRALVVRTDGESGQLVLVGLLRDRVADPDPAPSRSDEAVIDGKVVRFEARDEIVLQCGKGSITLRKDGKIVIKGTHLLSRASGVNRIKGGQVNIN